ncbi:MAG: V-type ATPase subunit, partial [Lachnospiraceae bacterium]
MGLLEYSAITTKIRAMSSSLFTDEDYRNLASLETVPEFVEYLRRSRGYNDIYSKLDAEGLHRGYLEKVLSKERYDNFARIYRFANVRQRKYMDLYFMRIEVSFIKTCHRMLFDGQKINLNLEKFSDFFDKHSDVNLSALSSVSSLNELH